MIILLPISVEVSKGGKGKAEAAFGDPPVSYVPAAELVLKISYDQHMMEKYYMIHYHHIIIISSSCPSLMCCKYLIRQNYFKSGQPKIHLFNLAVDWAFKSLWPPSLNITSYWLAVSDFGATWVLTGWLFHHNIQHWKWLQTSQVPRTTWEFGEPDKLQTDFSFAVLHLTLWHQRSGLT